MKATAFFVAMVLVVPVSATAQETSTSFYELSLLQILSAGDQIRITYSFGREATTSTPKARS